MGIGSGKYFEIEGVGRLIWELLEQQRSFSELVEAIVAEHEVEPAECERDVRDFIAALEAAHLVQKIEC
nr:PqqD family protein [Niveispirillum sp. SYP-B3756]